MTGRGPPGSTTAVNSASSTVTTPAATQPAIALSLTASPASFSQAGQTITYSYAVANTGNQTLTGVTVNNTGGPAGLSAIACPQSTLAPNGTETCTASYKTTQADVDAGSVSNTATVSGTTPASATVTSAQSSVFTPASVSPSLSLTLSASPASFSAAGQTVTFSYLVSNTGNVTLGKGALSNSLTVTKLTCPANSLAPGASETCTSTYKTTQADLDAGSVSDTAQAQGTAPGTTTATLSNTSTATVPAATDPAISLALTAAPASFTAAGQTLTYTYAVTNSGNVTLSSVGVIAKLPGVTTASCPQSSLAPGASETCTATYVTTQANVDAGSVTNSATAQGTPPNSATAATSTLAMVSTPANAAPSVSLTLSAAPASFSAAGQTITYSYAVTNTGNQTLTGVTVSDTALAPLSAVSCPGTTLAPGASETCTATYSTTQADVDAGSVANSATAQGTAPSTTVTSSPSSATVPAATAPALSLTMSGAPASFSAPGQTITYTYNVTNTGDTTLSGVGIDVNLDGTPDVTCAATLAPGASASCASTHVTTQADVDNGSVTGSAVAEGTPPNAAAPVTSAQASVTTPAAASATIALALTASPPSFSQPGQTITYSYAVTNTGDVTLTTLGITDTALAGLSAVSCPVTTLAPDASTTCTATYSTTQADVDAGSVANSATAQGTPPNTITGPPLGSRPGAAVPPSPEPGIPVVSSGTTLVAALRSTAKYVSPDGTAAGSIPGTWYGAQSVLPVIGSAPGWVHVRLAQRPNGSTAWVEASQVTLRTTPYKIVIDRSTTHLALFDQGRQVFSSPAGIGTKTDPTPDGHYFVAFFEAPPSPGYGAFVIVTSAHSETIGDWSGSGDALIGIHGPLGGSYLIGKNGARISHGCVRLPAAQLLRLRDVPPGTPVDVVG